VGEGGARGAPDEGSLSAEAGPSPVSHKGRGIAVAAAGIVAAITHSALGAMLVGAALAAVVKNLAMWRMGFAWLA